MNKKTLSMIVVLLMMLSVFTACGSSSGEAPASDAGSAVETQTEESAETATEADPYAWLGLTDIPKCNYLDIYSTYHFIRTYETYVSGYSMTETEAVDGANTYTENENSRVYSVDGRVVSLNENSKIYMETELSVADQATESIRSAQESGTNLYGRAFVGTGKGAVPGLESDTSEYEYYEFNYPDTEEATGTSITEQWFIKDGDIYAIYTKTDTGSSEMEYTEVIKSISADIPEGTFEIPDLSDYEKYE